MHPVMHFFVLIFMIPLLITGFEGLPPVPVMSAGNFQIKFVYYCWFEGLPPIPVMFTGSLNTGFGFAIQNSSNKNEVRFVRNPY